MYKVLLCGIGGVAGFHSWNLFKEDYDLSKASFLTAEEKGISVENIKKEVSEQDSDFQTDEKRKHVVVVGGGVVGVTTAYYLVKDYNYRVTLIEKEPDVAAATSWGNAGLISYNFSLPISSVSTIHTTLKSLLPNLGRYVSRSGDQKKHFKYFYFDTFNLISDLTFLKWGSIFLWKSYFNNAVDRAQFQQALKRYSSSLFHEILSDEKLEEKLKVSNGSIELYENDSALHRSFEVQRANSPTSSHPVVMLSHLQSLEKERFLSAYEGQFAGGIYYPGAMTVECPSFSRNLVEVMIRKYDVEIMTSTKVMSLISTDDGKRVSKLLLHDGRYIDADSFVLCLGADSNSLPIRSMNRDGKLRDPNDDVNILPFIPIFALRGYSARFPVIQSSSSSSPSSPSTPQSSSSQRKRKDEKKKKHADRSEKNKHENGDHIMSGSNNNDNEQTTTAPQTAKSPVFGFRDELQSSVSFDHTYFSRINEENVSVATIGEFQTSKYPLSVTQNEACRRSISTYIAEKFAFDKIEAQNAIHDDDNSKHASSSSHSKNKKHHIANHEEKNTMITPLDMKKEEIAKEIEKKIWMGRRPLSADGIPIISYVLPGLFVNAGHGMSGWMLSFGSGKIAASLVHKYFENPSVFSHQSQSPLSVSSLSSLSSSSNPTPYPLFSKYLFLNRFNFS